MSRVNRSNITEAPSQCAIMSQVASDCCYRQAAAVATTQSSMQSATLASSTTATTTPTTAATMSRSSASGANVFSPRERLEAMSTDFDMLKPLLMFNIENIQTYRADCKFRKARK